MIADAAVEEAGAASGTDFRIEAGGTLFKSIAIALTHLGMICCTACHVWKPSPRFGDRRQTRGDYRTDTVCTACRTAEGR